MRITHGIAPVVSQPSAVTIGNFDGVHLGHRAMLRRLVDAASQRGLVPCAVTFEPHPREFFAPDNAPARLSSLREKLQMLGECGIAQVHICAFNQTFSQLAAETFIERILVTGLQARFLLIGDDFRFGARRTGDFALLQARGAQAGFEVAAMHSMTLDALRISSTAVREALAAGDLDRAGRLLGRPYSISGRVVGGDKLGRDIGFPTANIQLKHNRPPLTGIFVVQVRGLADTPLPGVASLGVRPTVKENGRPVLEVHLLDFDRSIYGHHVCVDFLARLRDEEKYPDLPALVTQIGHDVNQARQYFLNHSEPLRAAKHND
ncbi:riboflavin biosynthesis protein [Sulfuriferula plumbiphila]|uniref:Riboflavin biosynthesis protein n=1 Tax=Sulfuriferula plumbiphila TaxID=171865 RepID=A0A512L9P0_9PROT|nr:bifunctional riboflavin kinase/FAD synthetase [Sulfuriferula plumbiphila]BBP03696.1 riboflavin biosynthesis protein [Sulfuriferula plumbiphila]GEP31206.1 riboflavin biosynthesis protein [Sulfuriferula plumbiphila]